MARKTSVLMLQSVVARRRLAMVTIFALIALSAWESIRPVAWQVSIPRLSLTAFTFTEFPSATPNPFNLAQGPDGRMYYVGSNATIDAVNLDGSGTLEYPIPSTCRAHDLALGPDSAVWFTEPFCSQIGRITASGTFTEYPLPGFSHGNPWDIVQGADLNLWFTLNHNSCGTGVDCGLSEIGRISPADGSMTFFQAPSRFGNPNEITRGMDGNVWFTEPGISSLGRALPNGTITEFPGTGNAPQVAAASDGRLWFSGGPGNAYGVMTTTGSVTAYTFNVGVGGSYLTQDLIGAADGNVWFSALSQQDPTAPVLAVLGNFDQSGTVRDFQLPAAPNPCCTRLPSGLATDSLTRVWYTDTNQQLIGHTDPLVVTISPTPTPPSQTGGGSPSTSPSSQCQHPGHPVSCASGELWHRFVDVSVKGRGFGLSLARTYSSTLAGQDGPFGFGWTHSYNMALSFGGDGSATVHEEGGSAITFAPDGSGGYRAATWVFATLVKNSDGTYTLKRKDQSTFTFSPGGQLVREQDRNQNPTSLAYNGMQLSTVTDAAGRQLQFAYSGSHVIKVTDPIQRTVSFQYDGSGNLIAATNEGGGVTRFTYDANHRQLMMTDPNGGVVTNTYDSLGRVVKQSDAMNRITTWVYGNSSSSVTDPKGNVTQETFQNGQLVSLTKGFGTAQAATWTLTYDPSSFALNSIIDPNGNATTYTLDSRGNVLRATNPLGQTSTFTYDALNDTTSATDPIGSTTQFSYDTNGNVTTISLSGSATSRPVTSLTYDTLHPGDVLTLTDPNGNSWHFAYDQFGSLTLTADPLGNVGTATYDQASRLTTSVSPKGNAPGANPANFTTTYTYNAFDNILSNTDPLGHTTRYQYDALQNLTRISDANGLSTTFAYDGENEPLVVTRADGSRLQNAYDADGNLISQVDPLGHATTYGYDSISRLVSMTDPLGRSTTIAYNRAGRPITRTDAMGRTSTFTYDAANELTGITYSDGSTPNVSLAYDGDARRVRLTDGTGTSTYAYDPQGRLTQSINGAGARVSYTYDLNGNQTALVYPDGSQVIRTFDAESRLASVTDWLGHRTSFNYDANSNLTGQSYPNGTNATFAYDAADQLTKITDSGPMGQLTFTEGRDGTGQLTSENVQGEPPGGPVTYGYDKVNRVVSANYGFFQLGYQYDAADHLTAISASSFAGTANSTLRYDAADQLVSLTATSGSKVAQTLQFTYDRNGNRTQQVDQNGAATNYSYDQANRLISYAGKAQYAYNGDGLRMSKTVGVAAEAFTWDMSRSLPLVIQDGTTRYVTGANGLPLEQVGGDGTVRYYHQDALGSTRALTNASGRIDSVYLYDPYGNVAAFSGSKIPNPFQFAGEYRDAESGLIYLRQRYYDPSTEQFITRDPISIRTREAYAYAHDTPLNGRDPSGLDSKGCQCVVSDIANLSVGDLLKDSAKAAFEQLLDMWHEGGIKAIRKLAGFAGRFIEGVDYLTAYFNAESEYSDVHDSDLHNAGVAISIYLQVAGPAGYTAIGALAGAAVTIETGPGAALGAIIGAFGGALVGGIVAYLFDTISHCVFVEAEKARQRKKQTAGP